MVTPGLIAQTTPPWSKITGKPTWGYIQGTFPNNFDIIGENINQTSANDLDYLWMDSEARGENSTEYYGFAIGFDKDRHKLYFTSGRSAEYAAPPGPDQSGTQYTYTGKCFQVFIQNSDKGPYLYII